MEVFGAGHSGRNLLSLLKHTLKVRVEPQSGAPQSSELTPSAMYDQEE